MSMIYEADEIIGPQGELAIRTLAMPGDTNPNGDIFGGWVVSQMDLAGLSIASKYTKHRIVTVAIDSMSFIAPVHVGDFVTCYAQMVHFGNTSLTIKIETWATGTTRDYHRLVTEGTFTYVSVDENRRPVAILRP